MDIELKGIMVIETYKVNVDGIKYFRSSSIVSPFRPEEVVSGWSRCISERDHTNAPVTKEIEELLEQEFNELKGGMHL